MLKNGCHIYIGVIYILINRSREKRPFISLKQLSFHTKPISSPEPTILLVCAKERELSFLGAEPKGSWALGTRLIENLPSAEGVHARLCANHAKMMRSKDVQCN